MKATGRSVWQNEKTGKWMYQVRIPRLASKPKVLQRTAKTKSEAYEKVEKLYRELSSTSTTASPKFVRELIANYLEIKKERVKPATLANNQYLLESYFTPSFGDRLASKVSSSDIYAFLAGLRPNLSTASINKLRSVLSSVFSIAVDFRQLEFNPVTPIKPFRAQEAESTQVCAPWSIEEVREVLQAFVDTPLDFFMHATLTLGLRRGEVLGLRWGDLNFDLGYIDVQVNRGSRRVILADGKVHTRMTEGTLKTKASRRRLALASPILVSLLRERSRREAMGLETTAQDFIVIGDSGKPIAEASMYRIYNRVLKAHGIRRIRIHDNRHTAAVCALGADVDLVKVAYGLGHGSPEVTKRIYAAQVPELSIAFSQGLANAIEGNSPGLNKNMDERGIHV